MRRLVHFDRRNRNLEHRQGAGDSEGGRSDVRAAFRDGTRHRVVHRAGFGAACDHRRGGALRGHGSLRQAGDPHRVVQRCRARTGTQLFRPGRTAHHTTFGHRKSLLSLLSRLGPLSDGRACYRRDRHCFAGDDFRGVFDDAASDSTRLSAANADPPHVGANDGADLRAGGELDIAGSRRGRRCRIRQLDTSRVRLWGRCHGHNARDYAAHLLRTSLQLALSVVALRTGHRIFHGNRRGVLCCGDAQGARRRLVSAGIGRDRVLHHDDVAPGP